MDANPDKLGSRGFGDSLAIKVPHTNTTMTSVLDIFTSAMKLSRTTLVKRKNLRSSKTSKDRREVLVKFGRDSFEGILSAPLQALLLWPCLNHEQKRLLAVLPRTPQCNPTGIWQRNQGSLESKLWFLKLCQLNKGPL